MFSTEAEKNVFWGDYSQLLCIQTSVSMFQGKAHFNDLHTEFIVEVTNSEHLRPKPFTSCGKQKIKTAQKRLRHLDKQKKTDLKQPENFALIQHDFFSKFNL